LTQEEGTDTRIVDTEPSTYMYVKKRKGKRRHRRSATGVQAAIMLAVPPGTSSSSVAASLQVAVVTGQFASDFQSKAVSAGVSNVPVVTASIQVSMILEPTVEADDEDYTGTIILISLSIVSALLCLCVLGLCFCLYSMRARQQSQNTIQAIEMQNITTLHAEHDTSEPPYPGYPPRGPPGYPPRPPTLEGIPVVGVPVPYNYPTTGVVVGAWSPERSIQPRQYPPTPRKDDEAGPHGDIPDTYSVDPNFPPRMQLEPTHTQFAGGMQATIVRRNSQTDASSDDLPPQYDDAHYDERDKEQSTPPSDSWFG